MNVVSSPFHADELAAQRLAGLASSAAAIRDHMPEAHRRFFESLGYVFVGALDARDWPVATIISAPPGFVQAPDENTLAIRGLPSPGDPAAVAIRTGGDVAFLGIDLATRRRNRANGVILDVSAAGFTARIQQSFGNCLKYIQRRSAIPRAVASGAIEFSERLSCAAHALISAADTLFVASRSRAQIREIGKVDVSHRGGLPGFITIDEEKNIAIPDFPGNGYFNTLGNLLGDSRAALLFIDFERGDLLQLQGRVTIDWAGAKAGHDKTNPSTAGRFWRFQTQRAWHRRSALPLQWQFIDQSPYSLEMTRAGGLSRGPVRC